MILMTTKNTHIKLKIYKDTKTHANCLEFKQATTAMVAKGQHHCRYTDLSVVFARWRQRAPNPIHGSWAHEYAPHPNSILIGSAVFAWLTCLPNTKMDHRRCYIGSNAVDCDAV